ncbi:unnamed protein product [Adineta ricciae]|uniref:Uncharacterized protein n=1 Tax=Adineta ricciae TaxID=249248 RepID=A0A816AXH3_ADIRI|nr:unnamed protein product [Adineta ricciae]
MVFVETKYVRVVMQGIILIILLTHGSVQQPTFDWLLYFSFPSSAAHFHDCLLIESTWYCQRPTNVSKIPISSFSCPENMTRSFKELRSSDVSAEELLNWSVPIDIAQSYAHYLSLATLKSKHYDNKSICHCTNDRFGMNCEYLKPDFRLTPRSVLVSQLTAARVGSFLDKWCLIDVPCQMGTNCLDWRYVCDGIEHCQFGEDEYNCELLEANECEVSEYRCRNGMCIPQDWLFDTMLDCQDESDEQRLSMLTKTVQGCRQLPYQADCAERLCSSEEPYSCGDGQCLRWQHLFDQQDHCNNYREMFHRCEMNHGLELRTTNNDGSCLKSANNLRKLVEDDNCTAAFRHLLLGKVRTIEPFNQSCNEFFNFPRQSFLTANMHTHYNKSIFYLNKIISQAPPYAIAPVHQRPHYFCFHGSATCNGIITTLNQSFCVSSREVLRRYNQWPFRFLLCSSSFTNSRLPHTRNNRGFWQCKSNERFISEWRIHDGYQDCPYGEDELPSLSALVNRPHRYRCFSAVPFQYISTHQLGDGRRDCDDGSDEISPFIDWNSHKCWNDNFFSCDILRDDEKVRQIHLAFHHYCNTVWDTWNGDDERNCTHWICSKPYIRCNRTGQCIKGAWQCDGEWDCADGEDERKCSTNKSRFSLEEVCHSRGDFFCITPEFIQDPVKLHLCISWTQVGNNQIDCLGATDERNTAWCREDNRMLGHRFRCANGSCIHNSLVCNGFNDCIEGSDEQVCYWMHGSNRTTSTCNYPQFQCLNGKCIPSYSCSKRKQCADSEHLFWCANTLVAYRGNKRSLSNYDEFCMGTREAFTSTPSTTSGTVSPPPASASLSVLVCNHGLIIQKNTSYGLVTSCFCPPNHYGDRCQYYSRRIPIRVRLDRLHRTDLPHILHIYMYLVCNRSEIVDYAQFVDSVGNTRLKYDRYLLYPQPKPSCQYSVRFEALNSSSVNIDLLAVWEYAIAFDFLPSYRFAKILRFPLIEHAHIPWNCAQFICQNNGTCHVIINRHELGDSHCQCPSEFTGQFCEQRHASKRCPCSQSAQCRAIHTDVTTDELDWFCVCPEGQVPPLCRLKNPVCRSNPCLNNGSCYAHAEVGNYTCICGQYYSGRRCEKTTAIITLYSTTNRYFPHDHYQGFLLQLFGVRRGFTVLRQQSLIHWHQLPLSIPFDSQDVFTELGFLHVFERQVSSIRSRVHLLYANCTEHTRFRFAVDVAKAIDCKNLMTTKDIHMFHGYCQKHLSVHCFYTEEYFCRCDRDPSRAECVSFHLDLSECHQESVCFNDGQCIHGNRLNRSDFVCICPLCTTGKRCQYAFGRFTVTLETLLVSMSMGSLYQLIAPALMFIFGLLFNGISAIVFYKTYTRQLSPSKRSSRGCSIYLLTNSIFSQLTVTLLLVRIVHLLLIRIYPINLNVNINLCRILPYVMSSMWFVSSWIMSFISMTRMMFIVWPKAYLSIHSSRFAARMILVTMLLVFASCVTYILSYRILRETTDQQTETWCVLHLSSSNTIYLRLAMFLHQIVPFTLNVISTLVLLLHISQSKANMSKASHWNSFVIVLEQRVEFLIAPVVCFVSQLPQIILIFLDSCQFIDSRAFNIIALLFYYFSFAPQISILLIYTLPSPLYKEQLREIRWLKHITRHK